MKTVRHSPSQYCESSKDSEVDRHIMLQRAFLNLNRACRCFIVVGIIIGVSSTGQDDIDRIRRLAVSTTIAKSVPGPVVQFERTELPNAVWIHEHLLSGGRPSGGSGFSALHELGIQTIISVDGIPPDVEGARQHDLCYVHLPIRYDGVPTHRAHELARAMIELPRPIYIHCHHGKHRGPAAAAVGSITAGLIDRSCGLQFLHRAGTGLEYQGLWSSVKSARPAGARKLATYTVAFLETIEPPALVEAMNHLETSMESLERQLDEYSEGQSPDPHGSVRHQALLLREQFTEIERLDSVTGRSPEFQRLFVDSQEQVAILESLLGPTAKGRVSTVQRRRMESTVRAIRSRCEDCHRRFRH